MVDINDTIKNILNKKKYIKEGYVENNKVNINGELKSNITILGGVTKGKCLVIYTDDNKIIAIPYDNYTNVFNEINEKQLTHYRRKRGETVGNDYDYCLIYSYVDLNYNPEEDDKNEDENEKDTINPDVSYAVRKNKVVTKAPECPLNMLHLGYQDYKRLIEPNFYGIPLMRYPYYLSRGEAFNVENGRYPTGDTTSIPNTSYLLENNFTSQITRVLNVAAESALKVEPIGVFSPLVPMPPSLIYRFELVVNMFNIRIDGRIGEKVIRFKYSNDYELELLKLHPYEIYKTYINQLDIDRFEICIKAGIKIDYDGFPRNQWDMKDIYEQIQNGEYFELGDDFYVKERQLVETTYEQLYLYKWYKGFYFVISNGEIEREETFTPLDDYKSFDYSIFEDGIYDKVFACSYAGNWDKFNKDGEPAITEDYYGNEIEYSDYIIYDFNNNLQNIRKYEDEDYENSDESNYIYVQKHNISWEWGNLYAFPNETVSIYNFKIPRLYSSISFLVGEDEYESDIYNIYNDHDYGYKNLNTFEKHILKQELNSYGNNIIDNSIFLIFSNIHNTLIVDNSMVDYGFYFTLDYPMNVNTYDKFSYVNFIPNATADYFPNLIHSEITVLDSKKKPWEYDYYLEENEDGEEEFAENIDKIAKLEFKFLDLNDVDNRIEEDNLNIIKDNYFEISKFDVHQKNLENNFGRGNLDYEKFHIENIYICKK